MEERNLMSNMIDSLKKKNTIKYHYYGHFHFSKTEIRDGISHNLLGINEMREFKKEV